MISLDLIQQAKDRIQSVVRRTPLEKNEALSDKFRANIFLKREDMQVVRSFKLRGAYNKIASLSTEEREKGVICASAGNHAQGVAFACAQLKTKGVIVMPATTPSQKISKVRYFGGAFVEVVLVGDTFDDAKQEAMTIGAESGAIFIHPFDDELVMAGQGTVAVEIIEDARVEFDYLIVAVGGGGLLAGVGSFFKQVHPKTKIIAVESTGAPALYEAIEAGKVVQLKSIDSFADGIAVKAVGDKTFLIAQEVVDAKMLVPEGMICGTMLDLYNDQAIVVEPAGAIGVAVLDLLGEELIGKNVCVILCGGNNDIARTAEIRERALLWEGRKHYFIIKFPQRAGALRDFLEVLGPEDDITHFEYTKKRNRETGPALVGIELKHAQDYNALIARMKASGINFSTVNDDPILFEMFV